MGQIFQKLWSVDCDACHTSMHCNCASLVGVSVVEIPACIGNAAARACSVDCLILQESQKEPLSAPPPLLLSIDTAQANAKGADRHMTQCAFLFLTDLYHYLPGLVKPFSLAAVEAPVHFDIAASMVTLYHFVIGKGENDAPVSAIEKILSSIIEQHLQAHDLPVSIPAVYTGHRWFRLAWDGGGWCL